MDDPPAAPRSRRLRYALAALALLIAAGLVLIPGCRGTRPTDLGVHEGRLKACPSSPNCVCSQADPGDAEHYVAPLTYTGSLEAARADLLQALQDLGLQVITSQERYVYAQATSALFRFVDDVEFYFPPDEPGVIQCRSASRLGYSDFGVNRKRIEAVRAKLAELAGAR